ncbi:MAG: Rieske 2Fe-2S domain-containing protein [Acidimicrobiales bacterium]
MASSSPISLGPVDQFPLGSLRMARAGTLKLVVVRTSEGFTVLDNACPHEGYGLVQGEVTDGALVCAWHNWRFRLSDGRCLRGEEDVTLHPAQVVDGKLMVSLLDPPAGERRARLLASLRRGLDDGYVGQISRDVVRLLRADADPVQLVWEAVAWGAPRAEFGFGHAMASLVDCLAMADHFEGDARALPVVAAFAGVAETERRRPLRPQPHPATSLPKDPGASFGEALEGGDLDRAEGLVRAIIVTGDVAAARRWLIRAVGDHQLSYGHGAIYVHKAFELLDRLGDDRAGSVLPHLVPALGWATRQDKLPYMRPFMKALASVDLAALADAEPIAGWDGDRLVIDALLGPDPATAVRAATSAVAGGGGVTGLLDAVTRTGAHRLLHYDPAAEVTTDRHDFGWLDLTHVITYAAAARWAWHADPGPHTARLALFTAFLAQYAGRKGYVEIAGEGPPAERPDDTELFGTALGDGAGSFIMAAHQVKTSWAAWNEAAVLGSDEPVAAVHRMMSAPRRERFVALNVRKAVHLADGRIPG